MRWIVGAVAVGGLGISAAAGGQTSNAGTVPPVIEAVAAPAPAPYPPPPKTGKERPAVPAGNPGVWVSVSDYPPAALREQRQGVTAFRLGIGADGRPKTCDITGSSGSPDLDAHTCGLVMRRAIFKPALDAKGQPTEGSFSSRIRWLIPKAETREATPGTTVRSFTIEIDGTATNCTEYASGKLREQPTTPSPCDGAIRFKPPVNANGVPVRKRVKITHSVEISDAP